MNRNQKWVSLAVLGTAVAFIAITTVTASASTSSNTPLYALRMEQASSEMSFLPADTNNFSYATERGHDVNCDVSGHHCSAEPFETATECIISCIVGTCCDTCDYTCVNTCSTCVSTCSSTCVSTCSSTCVNTCRTCVYTCPETCMDTCFTP